MKTTISRLLSAKKQHAPKRGISGSRKSPRSPYNAQKSCQKHVRKSDVRRPVRNTAQNNLGRLVAKTKIKSEVKKWLSISKILSKIADLPDGHIWSWRYISSIYNGTMQPSKKFTQALNAYIKNSETHKIRRCYFAGRYGVLMALDTSIRIDVIAGCIKQMGYKPVSYSKYNQAKKVMKGKE